MRALCASIITAGALIGMGLAAIGLGMRYQGLGIQEPTKIIYVKWVQLDTPMMMILVALLTMLVIGVVTAFVGLAYHHERRHYERSHLGKSETLGSRLGD